jgi:hypothetical protein
VAFVFAYIEPPFRGGRIFELCNQSAAAKPQTKATSKAEDAARKERLYKGGPDFDSFFHGGTQSWRAVLSIGIDLEKEPEYGKSSGLLHMPLRTGFIQMYQATFSIELLGRRIWS